jgi:hypothetical protein
MGYVRQRPYVVELGYLCRRLSVSREICEGVQPGFDPTLSTAKPTGPESLSVISFNPGWEWLGIFFRIWHAGVLARSVSERGWAMSGFQSRMGRWYLAVLVSLLLSEKLLAGELYFVMVFGSERTNHRARTAHTFATFVKATGQGPALDQYQLEVVTLSWVPETEQVRILRLCSERGVNYDLRQSLDWAERQGANISMWGPYQIDPELYRRAQAESQRLESGAVGYKAVVLGRQRDHVTNCIHVITDLADDKTGRYLGKPCWGEPASYYTALALLPFVIDRHQTHDWLIHRLGLDHDPINSRGLDTNPERGPIRRAIQNVFHRQALRNAGG